MSWENDFEQFKNVFTLPRLHVSNYFAELRAEVDTAFVKKDLNESEPLLKAEINKNWIQMIEKINEFENECLNKNKNNSFSKEVAFRAIQFIETFESIKIKGGNQINETLIKEMIYAKTVELERILFLNRLMLFLLRDKGHHVILCKKLDFRTTVGKLIYLNNEYMGSRSIQLIKKNQLHNLKKERLTNEIIKLLKLKEILVLGTNAKQIDEFSIEINSWNTLVLSKEKINHIDKKTFHDLIGLNTLRLNNNQIAELDKNVFTELVNLNDICLSNNQLTYVHPDLFKNLLQLKEIWLDKNKINAIEKNLFTGLINLTSIRLENNEITKINSETFRDLKNLKLLSLSRNRLKEIPKDTLTGLINLEWINLSRNQLETIDKDFFNNSNKLTIIDLNSNLIKEVDKEIFKDLHSLNTIDLGNNKLTSLDPDLFKDLNLLTLLELGGNQLASLDKNTFKSLVNLTEIYLSENKLTEIDPDLFQGLISVNVKIIFLSNNLLTRVDKNLFKGLNKLIRINLFGNLFSDEPVLELAIEESVRYVVFKNNNTDSNHIDSIVR